MNRWFACVLLVAVSGCPNVTADPGETQGMLPGIDGPTVEFDPANAIIPFPNNLVFDPATGRLAVPAPACESPTSKAIRTGTLNQLDGFGTFEAAMQVTFTEAVDPTSLQGNIVMYQRAKGATANDPASATQVPLSLSVGSTLRFDSANCAAPATIDAVNVIPTVPLDEQSTYTIAVLEGVKTASGAAFLPSTTWALVRQSVDPVTLGTSGHCSTTTGTTCSAATDCPATESCVLDVISEQTPLDPAGDANGNGIPDDVELNGLDTLWKAHAQGLAFLDKTASAPARSTLLVAWEITTQTTTDPLDPQVSGSPAATLATGKLLGTQSITCTPVDALVCPNGYDRTQAPYTQCGAESDTLCFLEIALGSGACGSACTPAEIYATGNNATGVCSKVGCAAVGDILAAGLGYTNYQTPTPNPMTGGMPIPGQWTDPVHPTSQGGGLLQVLVFVPAAPPATAAGYPTLVFGHGLGSSKTALFAFAPQLAAHGFASAAIDFVASGSRAIQNSNDPAIGCNGTPTVGAAPQCFAPILTADLGQTRDNIRQTVLDLQRLTNALVACGTAGCTSANGAMTNLTVDATHIVYTGQSLGGIIGTTTFSVALNMTAAVLNVPAVGLLDVLENSQTLEIKCPLVDALIAAGVVIGDPWNGMDGAAATGLCTTDAWKMQPGYAQFSSVARWVLDPADGANFMAKLVGNPAVPAGGLRRFLIQEVIGDMVVPNVATNDEGELSLGGANGPLIADPYIPTGLPGADIGPSAAVVDAVHFGAWVQYPPVPANGPFPGNTFQHASLLQPVSDSTGAGQLGTARLQTDAITFLLINN